MDLYKSVVDNFGFGNLLSRKIQVNIRNVPRYVGLANTGGMALRAIDGSEKSMVVYSDRDYQIRSVQFFRSVFGAKIVFDATRTRYN